MFSGGERQVVSKNFKGGKITAVFGGIELDLTKANLAPGVSELEIRLCIRRRNTYCSRRLDMLQLKLPLVLGGFSDSRKLSPGRTVDPTKHLVIKGAVVFGGGEVKSY